MDNRGSARVLHPTIEWNDVCEQLAARLHPDDELLVICAREEDPVASHARPRVSTTFRSIVNPLIRTKTAIRSEACRINSTPLPGRRAKCDSG